MALSRDGGRAIVVQRLEDERYTASHCDGFHLDAVVRLRPREEPCHAQFFVSGTFRAMWNAPGQTLRWDQDFDAALHDLSMIALGEFLDSNEVPPLPTGAEYTLKVPITSELFSVFKPQKVDDAELGQFVEGKIYWSWKYNLGPAVFRPWEARRLGVEVEDLQQAAFPNTGSLWELRNVNEYQALPALVGRFESKIGASSTTVGARNRYDVALSFAGEQREFVEAVAEALRSAGASVFYDGFAALWGKDLTVELESVYRTQSRYVVIFVSREYVDKAWPNLERQHALAGRIERMDDSVLPARFDDVALPGLPSSVGYLDIDDRTPEDLAALVLAKLGSTDV